MKRKAWEIGFFAAVLACCSAVDASPRERLRFDSDWKFVIDDRDLIELKDEVELKQWRWQLTEAVQLADTIANVAPSPEEVAGSDWREIQAPTPDVFKQKHAFAWFHAMLGNLELDSGYLPTLRFEQVDDNAVIYVNGRELARHEGPEEGFDVQIPLDVWNSGGENRVAVLVENHRQSGGILKPAWFGQSPAEVPVPPEAMAAFDDSSWKTVHLPHDYVVEGTFSPDAAFSHGYLPTPKAWYRRTFTAPDAWVGKSVWIDFDGIFSDANIWLNGKKLGGIRSGYIGKRFDLAPLLNVGGENILTVHVDPSKFEGWWYEGGGIYRHVWLNIADPLHIEPTSLFVKSAVKGLKKKSGSIAADLDVQLTVVNDGDATQSCQVELKVLDPNGKVVATLSTSPKTVAAHGTADLTLKKTLKSPALWSIEEPNLYQLVATVRRGDDVVDRETVTFGNRTIRFDPNHGFFLNEKPVKINGVCNHQDFAGIGVALPDNLHEWRIKKLQEMGCNAWRAAHNPVATEMLEACDRLGMLVLEENRHFGDTYSMKSSLSTPTDDLSDLISMVKRDRNHPSVIAWSIANEEQAIERTDDGERIAKAMRECVLEHDDTRPITAAIITSALEHNGIGSPKQLDIEGMNYKQENYIDNYHKTFPDRPCLASETVSQRSARGEYDMIEFKKGWRSFCGNPDKAYVNAYGLHPNPWGDKKGLIHVPSLYVKPINERNFYAGQFVWTGFDYRGEPGPFRWPEINSNFGIMDTCGFPKDDYYYYQSWWTDQPVVHLLPHWNWPEDKGRTRVMCHSNAERVELFLNGKSLGSKEMPKYEYLEWWVDYEPGTLEARAYKDGKLMGTDVVQTTGKAAAIRLEADMPEIVADNENVSPVEVTILDAEGRVIPTASEEVVFTVSGPGVVAGVGNGDPACLERDKASKRSAFNGHCMAVVQATDEPGVITLTATIPGIASSSIQLQSVAADKSMFYY